MNNNKKKISYELKIEKENQGGLFYVQRFVYSYLLLLCSLIIANIYYNL